MSIVKYPGGKKRELDIIKQYMPQKIELTFDKSVNTYILERTWHKNQKCKQNADGSVYLTFESNQLQETLYWVLHFGAAVTVMNPPELKEMYKDEIKKMAGKIK